MDILCYLSIFRIVRFKNSQRLLHYFYKLSTILTVFPQDIALFLTKKSTAINFGCAYCGKDCI